MTLAHAFRVVLPDTTGIPRDQNVNTWYAKYGIGSPGSTEFSNACDDFIKFYNTINDGVATISSYLASMVDRGSGKASVEVYAIPDARGVLGAPVYSKTWTVAAQNASGVDLPAEVATCLSYHGDFTGVAEHGAAGTRPKARRRGRIYIGPLITGVLRYGHGAGTPQRPDTAWNTRMIDSAQAMASALTGHGWEWNTFSRTDWAIHTVVGGWVDDEFDTQRRRGESPSSRTTYTV